jgi:hypothetical protein
MNDKARDDIKLDRIEPGLYETPDHRWQVRGNTGRRYGCAPQTWWVLFYRDEFVIQAQNLETANQVIAIATHRTANEGRDETPVSDKVCDDDDTTVIPPDLAPTQARAYSDAEDYDDAEQDDTQLAPTWTRPASWRLAWGSAAVVLACAGPGSMCWRCRGCSATNQQRSLWTPTRTCSTPTLTRWPRPSICKCAQTVPTRCPDGLRAVGK